jgi:hypothetical protein
MVQHLEAADLGALAPNRPTAGTAVVRTVVHVMKGNDHRMRLRVENSTGAWWVSVFPYRKDQSEIIEGDVIHARFTVRQRKDRAEAWANDVRVLTPPIAEAAADISITDRVSSACRVSSRVLVHTLALMAVAGETLDSWGAVDARTARRELLASIRRLPRSESHLLFRAAGALDL